MPTFNVLIVNVATALLLSTVVPSEVLPSLKVTVPVGVPVPGLDGGYRRGEGDGLAEHTRLNRRDYHGSWCSSC